VVVAPVVAPAVATTAAATAEPAPSGGRVSNDPRVNRRQAAVTVETKAVPIEYTQAPAAQPDVARDEISRASNDPRHRRNDPA